MAEGVGNPDLPGLGSKRRELLELLLAEKRRDKRQRSESAQEIRPRASGRPAVLSFGQRRLWFIEQLQPNSAAYHVPGAVRMKGDLDRDVLARALRDVGRRHEILRTAYPVVDGEPTPRIDDEPSLELLTEDLRSVPDEELEAEVARRVDAAVLTPFDLSRAPLARTHLFRLRDDEHVFLLILHHIVSDIWSVGVFFRNVTALYDGFLAGNESPLPALPIQYSDYAAWQEEVLSGRSLDHLLDFWNRHLEGAPTVLDLPTDHPRPPVQSFTGGRRYMQLGVPLTDSLKDVARSEEASLYMLLAAALNTILYRMTGQAAILLGVPMANRNRLELEGLVGLLFNQLVLRTDLSDDKTFRELLVETKSHMLGIFAHQDLPFERLVRELQVERDMSRNPIFQVLFAFQNVPPSAMQAKDLELSRYEVRETTSREDLELDMRETPEGLAGWFGYDAGLFDATTVERIKRRFCVLLESVAADPDLRLGEMDLMRSAERHQVLVEWNDTDRGDALGETVRELWDDQVARRPDAPAVTFRDRTHTYAELDRRARRMAWRLIERGVEPGAVVGLLADRSDDFLTAMWAVWKAGGAYVPLDPTHPPHRHRQVLRQSGTPWVLTDESLGSALEQAVEGLEPAARPEMLRLSELLGPGGRDDAPPLRGSPRDLAYVIYTSGSTGTPKGAMVEQRGMVNHLRAKIEDLDMGPGDLTAQTASQCFDISVWQFIAPLLSGGRVIVYEDAVTHDPAVLLERTDADGVTILETVPSLLRTMLLDVERRDADRPELERLRWMISTGEALPPELSRRWRLAYPGIPLFNAYGPTECSDDVTHHVVVRGARGDLPREPIGRSVRHTRLYVMDRGLRSMPMGVPGELVVAGAGVGRGYLREPRRTAEAFVPDPFADGLRAYRTGDRVRWMADGTLDFLGRIDHQVKVRGFRIELGEIESVLAHAEQVRQSVVVARKAGASDNALVAYVVPGNGSRGSGELDEEALRSFLGEKLPEYMVPAAFVALDALPLTPNGKVDRKALLEHDVRFTSRTEYVAPRTPVEETLAEIWTEILDVDRVGAHDHFFDVGGQSLLAAQVVSRIREAFGVEVPVRVVFQEPRLADLAERVDESLLRGDGSSTLPLERVPRDGTLRPSFGQERFWFIDRWRPNLTAYNIFGAVRMRGDLDLDVLQRSFDELLRRHEVLRTVFREVDGRPIQVIRPPHGMELPVVDLRRAERSRRHDLAVALGNRWAQAPFDLENGPLIRATLLRLSDEDHVLAVTAHHIVYDVWSREILVRELGILYEAFWHDRPSPLTELPIQYADFAHYQREWMEGEGMEAQLDYWMQRLEGAGSGTELPSDRPRPPVQSFRGTRTELELSADLTAGLKSLSRRAGGTLFMTLMAGFTALLHRYTGEDDLVVGSPIANRNRGETESLIGFLVNTLVLRLDASGNPTFLDLMGRAREVALGAYSNQDLPFELLVNEMNPARDASRQPFFQIMFNYMTNYRPIEMELPELTLTPEANHSGASQFDLILSMYEVEDRLHFTADYSLDLYDPTTLRRYLRHFVRLLDTAVADADVRLAELSPWSGAERHQILTEWNDTAHGEADGADRKCAHELIEAAARRFPRTTAVVDARGELTYEELDHRANGLARRLVEQGVGTDDVVAMLMERGVDFLVTILAVFKAGGAYLPLNGRHPMERHRQVLEQSGCRCVLVGRVFADRLEEPLREWEREGGPRMCFIEDLLAGPAAIEGPAGRATTDSLAYVIFTSGSTGTPKGVTIPHHGLVNQLLFKVRDLELTPDSVVAQTAAHTFDISVWQFLAALLAGGRVHVFPDEVTHDPPVLLEEISAHGVTVFETVPSIMKLMLDAREDRTEPVELSRLSRLLPTGEALPPSLAARWLEAYPDVPMLNAYGPAECADDVSEHLIDTPPASHRTQMPIGTPIDNLRMLLLDSGGYPVPVGATGEIYIGGVGVGRGYLNDPGRTAEVFLPDPRSGRPGDRLYRTGDLARQRRDGTYEFLGRVDQQVKIRGSRIELGEIESVLMRRDRVEEAAVLVKAGAVGDQRLVAYVVGDEEIAANPAALRSYLEDRLPDYMLPAAFVFLDALPRNANGKVDRRRLADVEAEEFSLKAPYVEPRNDVEKGVAEIWSELLGVEEIGAHDNFFDLGGHSLLTTQLVSRLRGVFEVEIPLPTFFEEPTVAGLAEAVELARWAEEVARERRDGEPSAMTATGAEATSAEAVEVEIGEI